MITRRLEPDTPALRFDLDVAIDWPEHDLDGSTGRVLHWNSSHALLIVDGFQAVVPRPCLREVE